MIPLLLQQRKQPLIVWLIKVRELLDEPSWQGAIRIAALVHFQEVAVLPALCGVQPQPPHQLLHVVPRCLLERLGGPDQQLLWLEVAEPPLQMQRVQAQVNVQHPLRQLLLPCQHAGIHLINVYPDWSTFMHTI